MLPEPLQYPGLPEIFWMRYVMQFFVFEYWFYINVPDDYDDTHLIDLITGKAPLRDEDCTRVSHHLIPGRTYGVKIFIVREPIEAEGCLIFLNAQNRTRLVGTQGLFFLVRHYKRLLPFGIPLFSLDQPECLPKDHDGTIVMPYAMRTTLVPVDFGYSEFYSFIPPGIGLVCFSEVPHDLTISS